MAPEQPTEYDIEYETKASLEMLGARIPATVNTIKRALIEIRDRQLQEPWRVDLTIGLTNSIEQNCRQLLDTIDKDALPSSAWISRNLLELWVWVKFCVASKENARRFYEDALRDLKGLLEANTKSCASMGIANEFSAIGEERIQRVASERLGLDHIDSKFMEVALAAKSPDVGLGDCFAPLFRSLSKFAHPTAALVLGVPNHAELRKQLQAIYTTKGVYFAAQATLVLESHVKPV